MIDFNSDPGRFVSRLEWWTVVGSEETLAESTSLGWDSSSPLHDHKELNDNLWDGHEGALVVQRETAYNWRPQLQTTETDASKFINMQIVRRRMSPSVAFLEFGKREERENASSMCQSLVSGPCPAIHNQPSKHKSNNERPIRNSAKKKVAYPFPCPHIVHVVCSRVPFYWPVSLGILFLLATRKTERNYSVNSRRKRDASVTIHSGVAVNEIAGSRTRGGRTQWGQRGGTTPGI